MMASPVAGEGPRPVRAAAVPDTIPRLPSLPWVGAPRAMLTHPGRYLLEGHHRLGPVFRIRLFGMEMVVVIGPEVQRQLLVTERDAFSHAAGYAIIHGLLGEGLLFQDGEQHRRNRALMTPAFHQQGVNRYLAVMAEVADRHLARWAAEGRDRAYDRFRDLTFEVMARLILGVEDEADLARLTALNDDLAKAVVSFPRLDVAPLPFARGLRARDEIKDYLRAVVRRRRADPAALARQGDALALLIAAREGEGDALSADEIAEQGVILMFAGHETTTSMLSSTLLALHRHPELVPALRTELEEVAGGGEITALHLERLRLLDAVVKEVERLWPPISVCNRGVVREVELGGHRLAPGTLLAYCPWASHRLPAAFAEPERFDPARFLPPRREDRATPYALIGFGGGGRLCIGQAFAKLEVKLVIARILRDYDCAVDPADPRLRHVPTLHPRTGLPATLRRRARPAA